MPNELNVLHLHPSDNIAIAKTDLARGAKVGVDLRAISQISSGHKIALSNIAKGERVLRYGQVIGVATQDIPAGAHVHSHNLAVSEHHSEASSQEYPDAETPYPLEKRRTFMGYRRRDGRVGTRNTVAVISTVSCSAFVARQIANHFTPEILAKYPNVTDVVPLTHEWGCSTQFGGPDHQLLRRTLAGIARNPNVASFVLVGLGCEICQIANLIESERLTLDDGSPAPSLVIQESGGTQKSIARGIVIVEDLLEKANGFARTPEPISELAIALQCGGSDGWSGVTANPVVGLMADEIVRQGGSVVLTETPEIYGGEHLLASRAVNVEVAGKLLDRVRWWENHVRQMGMVIDNNPSPGNKAGGLTTIYEKSLGAIAKAGSTPLMGVFDYAEPICARGFTFMDGPSNDAVSTTGQVASGCNLIVFTTGCGSVLGFHPVPSIKVCTNSKTFAKMEDDMDLNAGRVIEDQSMEAAASELLELVIAVASGQKSKSEAQGIGEDEFIPWTLGRVL